MIIENLDLLQPSDPDIITLSKAVYKRLKDLREAYLRIRGVHLFMPADMVNAVQRWETMIERHKKGDYRNTQSELEAVRFIAQWSVTMNCHLRNQPDVKLEWKS